MYLPFCPFAHSQVWSLGQFREVFRSRGLFPFPALRLTQPPFAPACGTARLSGVEGSCFVTKRKSRNVGFSGSGDAPWRQNLFRTSEGTRDGGNRGSASDRDRARRCGQDRAREPRRHDNRVLRLLHFWHGGGAGVRRHVLPEIGARDPDAQRLSDLRHRLSGPAGRLVPVRPFRRPGRAQVDARRHHADDGARDHPDRRPAGLRDRRRARGAAARDTALPPGRRPRRRMGRGGPDRGRERARRQARLVRHVSSARAAGPSSLQPVSFFSLSSRSARRPLSTGPGAFPSS